MSRRKNCIRVRADPDSWEEARSVMGYPKITDREISTILWKTSPLRIENMLRKAEFKDKLGRIIYGKKAWNDFTDK